MEKDLQKTDKEDHLSISAIVAVIITIVVFSALGYYIGNSVSPDAQQAKVFGKKEVRILNPGVDKERF